jgi:hypothetical protein
VNIARAVRVPLILAASATLAIFIPWIAAVYTGVIHRSGVKTRMLAGDLKKDGEHAAHFESAKEQRRSLLEHLDEQIGTSRVAAAGSATATPSDYLTKLIEARNEAARPAHPVVNIDGFADSDVPGLWFLDFVFLGCLVFVAMRLTWRWWFILVGFAYVVFEDLLPSYLRYWTCPTSDLGRATFAYYAFDIDRLSFCLQEICMWIDGVLLVMLFFAVRHELADESKASAIQGGATLSRIGSLNEAAARVTERFDRWRVRSLLLAAAFVPWTYFDYSSLRAAAAAGGGDELRYLYTASVDHLTWIGLWAYLSVSVVTAVKDWRVSRAQFLVFAVKKRLAEPAMKAALEIDPIGPTQLGSAVAAVLSTLVPVIALFH